MILNDLKLPVDWSIQEPKIELVLFCCRKTIVTLLPPTKISALIYVTQVLNTLVG